MCVCVSCWCVDNVCVWFALCVGDGSGRGMGNGTVSCVIVWVFKTCFVLLFLVGEGE